MRGHHSKRRRFRKEKASEEIPKETKDNSHAEPSSKTYDAILKSLGLEGKKPPKDLAHVSLDPMKFGSEKDFHIALTELAWLKEARGEIGDNEIENVAQKYAFPFDFLKHGFVDGLDFPGDYIISKSKWFPIVYAWEKRMEYLGDAYLAQTVQQMEKTFWFIIAVLLPTTAGIMIWSVGYTSILPIVTGVISATISLGLWTWNKRDGTVQNRNTFTRMYYSEAPTENGKLSVRASISAADQLVKSHPFDARRMVRGKLRTPRLHSYFLGEFEDKGKPVPIMCADNIDKEYAERVKAYSKSVKQTDKDSTA